MGFIVDLRVDISNANVCLVVDTGVASNECPYRPRKSQPTNNGFYGNTVYQDQAGRCGQGVEGYHPLGYDEGGKHDHHSQPCDGVAVYRKSVRERGKRTACNVQRFSPARNVELQKQVIVRLQRPAPQVQSLGGQIFWTFDLPMDRGRRRDSRSGRHTLHSVAVR